MTVPVVLLATAIIATVLTLRDWRPAIPDALRPQVPEDAGPFTVGMEYAAFYFLACCCITVCVVTSHIWVPVYWLGKWIRSRQRERSAKEQP